VFEVDQGERTVAGKPLHDPDRQGDLCAAADLVHLVAVVEPPADLRRPRRDEGVEGGGERRIEVLLIGPEVEGLQVDRVKKLRADRDGGEARCLNLEAAGPSVPGVLTVPTGRGSARSRGRRSGRAPPIRRGWPRTP